MLSALIFLIDKMSYQTKKKKRSVYPIGANSKMNRTVCFMQRNDNHWMHRLSSTDQFMSSISDDDSTTAISTL